MGPFGQEGRLLGGTDRQLGNHRPNLGDHAPDIGNLPFDRAQTRRVREAGVQQDPEGRAGNDERFGGDRRVGGRVEPGLTLLQPVRDLAPEDGRPPR